MPDSIFPPIPGGGIKELGQPGVPTRHPYRGEEFSGGGSGNGFFRVATGYTHLVQGDNQVVTNSTTLVSSNDLSQFFDIRVHYLIEAYISFTAHADADFKLALRYTGSAAIRAVCFGQDTAGAWLGQYMDETNTVPLQGNGVATYAACHIMGTLDTDTTTPTPGRFVVQFAQQVAHASDAALWHPSWVRVTRIGGSFA